MSGTLSTLRAAWPVLRRAIASGQVLKPQCELVPALPDIEALYDVEIPMSEGFSLTANVFRSRAANQAGQRTPVIMCAHPYDNRKIPALGRTPLGGPPQQYRLLPQTEPLPKFSTLASWESPDPNFWVPAGYTLVNVNLPGFANSGGKPSVLSAHQGKCFREAIRWAADAEWSTGSVGLCGVSFLCISQYLAAASPNGEQVPEGLKCIIPWEGVSNLYQDLACRGGVVDTGFLNFWWETEVRVTLNVSIEDYLESEEAIPGEVIKLHPFYDDYWRAKAPPLENITVPMLVCASFSDHELHTFGSFRAYEKASSAQKWLYTHRSGKWAEYYRPEALELQREFMDHFCMGKETTFPARARVRIETRKSRDEVEGVRWENEWPLPNTEYTPLYLDGVELAATQPGQADVQTYSGTTGRAEFKYVFAEDTELTGYIKLKVWMELGTTGSGSYAGDFVVCAFVDKRGPGGESIRFNGSVGIADDMVTRGYGRAARRTLDPTVSTFWHPVPQGTSDDPLAPGDVVPLEIAFCPSSTFFAKGEQLVLIVAGYDVVHAPIFKKDTSINSGPHVIHFGGRFDSHLLIPKIGA